MADRMTNISKYLSKHLRHTPEALGLKLQPGGWVRVEELLAACDRAGFPIAYDELIECVEFNDKQRFSFDGHGDLIRANQGHSTAVDLMLEEKKPPDLLYHGTTKQFLPSILAEGLSKRKRHHVHLSTEIETARRVGARRGKPVILVIDAAGMADHGMKFFESENGVWLTDTVPTGYLKVIED